MTTRQTTISIIGGGPAGLIAALYLARLPDVRIVVYEKQTQDAYTATPCAEGISARTLLKLETDTGFCSTPFIVQSIAGIRVIFPNSTYCVYHEPGATLNRDTWQRALALYATEQGIEIVYNARIQNIEDLDSDYIIGADGPASRVRAAMNQKVEMAPACQYRMVLNRPVDYFEFYFHPMFHQSGRDRAGYGWVFPRDDVCNVGVKGTYRVLAHFLETFHITGTIIEKSAAPIPINGSVFENGRTFLIGDAGGMPNPLTFGGLSPIIHCADYLFQAIGGQPGMYTRLIKNHHFYPPYWAQKRHLFYNHDLMNRLGTIYNQLSIYPPSFKLISRTLRHPGLLLPNLRLVRHLRRIKRVSW
ncbi:MAG: NAD(P)/FAD-dependent oxidoreductase [Thermodesulfobacteriota bacterium]|nr:NAD(P)/FAD-dependent oxidoreductase [Thermodesulfobacteriota bacterium]